MSLKQPVQYPVKYYSHLDAEAPQLANIDGNIKTILKACLVTGIGDKPSAGWGLLFEDDFRIVLRRPLRTGNPPDIKIENGVIGGTASHRIVSQDNPTGLDDATELASINLLARDADQKLEWHLIVSDFGFIFCQRRGSNGNDKDRSNMIYCGELQRFSESQQPLHYFNADNQIKQDGTSPGYSSSLLGNPMLFKNMISATSSARKDYLSLNVSETYFDGDYVAQKIIISNTGILPFFVSISSNQEDLLTKVINIDNRQMLRYVDNVFSYDTTTAVTRAYYIPLDYWEL